MATILIAEDERDIRELIGMTLTFGGHKVFKAANGAEAVEMAPTVMPDLIMMDVRMPRMTGFEACMQLKTIDSVKHIPVVFLSAKGQEAEIESGLEAGAYDFILKPFSPADLIVRINQILAATPKPKVESAASAPIPVTSAAPAIAPVATDPAVPTTVESVPTAPTPPIVAEPIAPIASNEVSSPHASVDAVTVSPDSEKPGPIIPDVV